MPVEVAFSRSSDWGHGFVGQVVLDTDRALAGWTLAFDAGFIIDNIWGAEVVSQADGRVVLRNAPWNADVPAGGRITLGFTAGPGGSVPDPSDWQLDVPGLVPPTPPEVDIAGVTMLESEGVALFRIGLSHAATAPVTVSYATEAGTARAGTDFRAALGSVTFAAGETSRVVAVTLVDDAVAEGTESFNLRLTGASGGTLGAAVAEAVVLNDDGPRIEIADASVVERNSGQASLSFTVTLAEASTKAVLVRFATADGTAVAGEDYLASSGTLRFDPGETSRNIVVKVLGDRVIEADETVLLHLSHAVRGVLADGAATGTLRNDDLPRLMTADAATITEGDPGGRGLQGVLSTAGREIVDATGAPARIAALNWFGMETTAFAPHGLHLRNWREMMEQMAELGFNAIRLPFSAEAIQKGGTPNGIDFRLNPDLAGLTPVQIIDRIVEHAGEIGLRIILDHHRSSAGNGPNGNGLWYEGEYTTARWVKMWEELATRYAGNPTVIGADLHNEPHGANWKSWATAAEIAGNAVLAKNPDWLILVEGVGQHDGEHYWWGGNLAGARDRPILLNQPDKLVYAPHDYPNSVFPQPFFYAADFPDNLPAIFDRMWGYLWREGTAPVLVGELGSRLTDPRDQAWMEKITAYLGGDTNADGVQDVAGAGVSYAWWSWNPNSGDTGGILADDWHSVNFDKIAALQPILPDVAQASRQAVFTVSLTAPGVAPVTVGWQTMPGTADETDYVAAAGTLVFAPGETSKTVAITLRPDEVAEGTEWFRLALTSPDGATIADGNGIARITDDDWVV
ncbi:cellulase family glycosylhydrolase [Roseomonas frigidaquae]|uniref:cellulase n=1 Tax=Falsiroseomonas frigidaquae TaxID=487318 RepID=A0ABX1F0K6_9PROT|nr:Calx-beta domain-containing protein [Falsiroseomonas frigidaquae]NKE45875.1 cellulase family glycosylhydrolase [Falsiroseomonas frigidaquae]